jgi:hypothetical protein
MTTEDRTLRPFGRGSRGVSELEARPGSVHHRGFWRVIGPDSVQVVFTTGFSGVVLFVHPDGSAWRGVAATFWDFDRQHQYAPVLLTPLSCT